MVAVEGATAGQRALLQRLVAVMPNTRLEALRLEPLDPGLALIATRPAELEVREEWETRLLGVAFRDRAAAAGLPPVLCAGHLQMRAPLESSVAKPPPDPKDLQQVEDGFRQAVDTADVRVASVEIFEVAGHALAARLEVDEPHS